MKAVVFACHGMGCQGVQALLDTSYGIAAIFTRTDNPDEKAFFGPVSHLTASAGIPVYAPNEVNHPLWIERIGQLTPDVVFSFHYRHLLSDEILSPAPEGAFSLHDSLLPKYRDRAPLNRVLVNGETETGVTLHRMVKRANAGVIVTQQHVAIPPGDVALTLHRKLYRAARHLLEQTLPAINAGSYPEFPQQDADAARSGHHTPEDSFLD